MFALHAKGSGKEGQHLVLLSITSNSFLSFEAIDIELEFCKQTPHFIALARHERRPGKSVPRTDRLALIKIEVTEGGTDKNV